MKYWLTIGRFQPFHYGHETLIKTKLRQGKNVLIALRDTGVNKKNPYTYEERKEVIEDVLKRYVKEGRVKVIKIPDIEGVFFGRGVGYEIEEIRLDDVIESISGTKIRKEARKSKTIDPDVYKKPVGEVLEKHANIKIPKNNKAV